MPCSTRGVQLPLRWQRRSHVFRTVRATAAVLLLAACAITPTPTPIGPTKAPGPSSTPGPTNAPGPSTPELATGTVTEGGITLAVTAEPVAVRAGQLIDVEAVLTHDRPEPLVVSGSGSGIVFFSVTRIEDRLTSGAPVMTMDCGRRELPAGEPLVVPFFKSGGYSPGDPNAEFMESYNATPDLRLPAGTWQIDVTAHGTLGEGCDGQQLRHALSVLVTVTE